MASKLRPKSFELSDDALDAVLLEALKPPALSPDFQDRLRCAIARESRVNRAQPMPEPDFETDRDSPLRGPQLQRLTLRAGLLLVCPVLAIVGSTQYKSYSTAIGVQEQVTLPGSFGVMKLNTDTELHLLGDATAQVAVLKRGEAFFQLTPNSRPTFEVVVGDSAVTNVGASFSVRVLPDGRAEVTVPDGRAAVKKSRGSDAQTSVTLGPGEIAIAGPDGIATQRPEKGAIERKLSWTEGRLTFAGESLEDAIAEFNRYNSLKLVIVDPSIRLMSIGAMFSPWDPEGFAASLCVMKVHSVYSRAEKDEPIVKTKAEERILLYGLHKPPDVPATVALCPQDSVGSR